MSFLSDLLGSAYKEGMTEEEISAALETVHSGSSAEINKLKTALSKANGEAADYKKQLRAKMSEDEQKEADRKAEYDRIIKENNDLKRNMFIAEKGAAYIAMGYDPELAKSTATAMFDGDMDTVIKNQASFTVDREAAIKADLMKNTHRPMNSGSDTGTTDYNEKIADATAKGDFAAAAYYTRLAQQDGASE